MAVSQLQKIFDARDVKHQTVADYLGVSRQSVTQWVKLGAPSRKYLDKLASFLDVNPLQLTGDMPFLTEDEVNAARQKILARDGWMILRTPDKSGADADSPDGIIGSVEVPVSVLRQVSGREEISPEEFIIINTPDDTMAPTLQPDSCCLVDTQQRTITGNGLYALRSRSGGVLITRVQDQLNGSVKLISDNPKYPPLQVSLESLQPARIIGRVVLALSAQRF